QLTAFDAGMLTAWSNGSRACLSAWHAGRQRVFIADNLNLSKGVRPQLTELGKETRKEYNEWLEFQGLKTGQDTLMPAPPDTGELIQVRPVEHADPEEKKPLKYYLFDEEETPGKTSQAPKPVGNTPVARTTNTNWADQDIKRLPVHWGETEVRTPKRA